MTVKVCIKVCTQKKMLCGRWWGMALGENTIEWDTKTMLSNC